MNFTDDKNEQDRLRLLLQHDLLQEIEEPRYREIAEIASLVCRTPVSLVTVLDTVTQYHKGQVGFLHATLPIEASFCRHAVEVPEVPLIIPDARLDERFRNNPLVIAEKPIIFYAGFPLVLPAGTAIGALCVIDEKPRKLSEEQLRILSKLANQVVTLFSLQRVSRQLRERKMQLRRAIEDKEEYIDKIAHDIKTALRSIEVSAEVLQRAVGSAPDSSAQQHLMNIQEASSSTMQFINDLSEATV